jgi:hypothetical protein
MQKRFGKLVLLIILLLNTKTSKADLFLIGLSLKLECLQTTFSKDEIVQFNLTLSNASDKAHSILLPGSQNRGPKLVHFSFFSVKNNFYKEVYRESTLIDMDTTKVSSSTFKRLPPKGSTVTPLFLNDKVNYRKHIEANHPMPNLPAGQYEVLVWYSPWDDSLCKYVYHKVSDFKTERSFDPEKLNLPEGSLNSNYVTVNIVEKKIIRQKVNSTFCPANCSFCTAIEKSNWDKVASIIDRQSYYHKTKHPYSDSTWQQAHRNVAWLSDGPDAVLSSLPTWYSRNIIFKNSKGFHYYSITWQMGKIYHNRSRIKMYGRMIGIRIPIKTEEIDYFRLISFFPY